MTESLLPTADEIRVTVENRRFNLLLPQRVRNRRNRATTANFMRKSKEIVVAMANATARQPCNGLRRGCSRLRRGCAVPCNH